MGDLFVAVIVGSDELELSGQGLSLCCSHEVITGVDISINKDAQRINAHTGSLRSLPAACSAFYQRRPT